MHLPAAAAVATAVVIAAPPAQAASWRAPTPGAVTRGFALGADPFEAGRHRGADFAVAPGSPVRAACAGRVVVATRIGASGGVVTIACGPWRVTHLPLARIATRTGRHVAAGDPIGTAAPSRAHAGIHLGVRRATTRFGYVDPLRFIHAHRAPPPAGPGARARRGAHRARRPAPVAPPETAPVAAPRPAPRPVHLAAPRPPPVGVAAPDRPFAPWAAWAGLAALLLAAAGGGVRIGGARRRVRRVRTSMLAGTGAGARAPGAHARDDLPP